MIKRFNSNITIAVCASCAIVAFALYQRYAASVTVPVGALFIAAAIICLLPVLYGLILCKTRRNKTNAG